MSFSPNLFMANIKAKDGLAKPNRFQVILPIPTYIGNYISTTVWERLLNLPNTLITDISSVTGTGKETANPDISRSLSLQCDSAELPGKTLITADAKIYGPTFKVPYQTAYNDMTLNFLCTNEFYERKLFELWMEAIMPTDTNNLRYAKDEATRYLTNITVIQYDEFIKQIYAVELIDAFPIGIAGQQVFWSDDGIHRLSIQFAYQKYRPIYKGNYDLKEFATTLFGSYSEKLFDKIFKF